MRNLVNIAKQMLNCEKKVFAKPGNLAKLVFAKLAKQDFQNLAKHCETLIAKIAKVAKIE